MKRYMVLTLLLAGCAVPSSPSYVPQEKTTTKPVETTGTFSEGTYEVPSDIKPGKYKTKGGDGCYYARLGSLDTSDIEDNALSDGPMVVQVKKTDAALELRGSCTWKRVK